MVACWPPGVFCCGAPCCNISFQDYNPPITYYFMMPSIAMLPPVIPHFETSLPVTISPCYKSFWYFSNSFPKKLFCNTSCCNSIPLAMPHIETSPMPLWHCFILWFLQTWYLAHGKVSFFNASCHDAFPDCFFLQLLLLWCHLEKCFILTCLMTECLSPVIPSILMPPLTFHFATSMTIHWQCDATPKASHFLRPHTAMPSPWHLTLGIPVRVMSVKLIAESCTKKRNEMESINNIMVIIVMFIFCTNPDTHKPASTCNIWKDKFSQKITVELVLLNTWLMNSVERYIILLFFNNSRKWRDI